MNLKLLEWGDNPYRVVAPHPPSQYALQAPYANAITRISWTGNDPADPNPVVSYDVEGCLNPFRFVDTCTPSLTGWTSNGFFYTASGLSGGGYDAGNGNGIMHTLTMERPFVVETATDSLRFSVNYLTEQNYDYGYVQVSTSGGVFWTTIPGNITTSANPYGNNLGHGFTGSSSDKVDATFRSRRTRARKSCCASRTPPIRRRAGGNRHSRRQHRLRDRVRECLHPGEWSDGYAV